jgi:oxygen-dependent protoporphyrinogen oxidase
VKSVAIIGGGITGLTAAYCLQRQGVPVTLYEAKGRTGGVIRTIHDGGFMAECGPNTALETSPKISTLIRDLDLEPSRIYSDPRAHHRYLVRNGKLQALPTSPLAFLRSPLFSASAKWRLLAEPFLGRAAAEAEESVGEFVVRRLGREFLDYAIDPLVGGIYAGDPARLSVRHAFPKLHALEQKYGSLILGQIRGSRERKRRAEVSKQNARQFSFTNGLQSLTDRLTTELGENVLVNSSIAEVSQTDFGWRIFARRAGEILEQTHSAVLFAGTAPALAGLTLHSHRKIELSPLQQICYAPVASVVLGFRREDVRHPLDGFGALIPALEQCNILGTIFSSSLFPNRAPDGHVLLTSYLGGLRQPEFATRSESDLIALTLRDLRHLLGVNGTPRFQQTFVFERAIPQYEVGYGRFKQIMNDVERDAPGFFIAGNFRNGISVGDCVSAGFDVAQRMEQFLVTARHPAPQPLEAVA